MAGLIILPISLIYTFIFIIIILTVTLWLQCCQIYNCITHCLKIKVLIFKSNIYNIRAHITRLVATMLTVKLSGKFMVRTASPFLMFPHCICHIRTELIKKEKRNDFANHPLGQILFPLLRYLNRMMM